MDTFGINWFYLLSQIGFCFGIALFVALIAVFVNFNQPSKVHRLLIGFITAWVLFYLTAISLASIVIFILSINGLASGFDLAFNLYNRSMPISMPTFILYILLIFYYLLHAAKSSAHSKKERELYIIGLLFLPFFVMPVYYLRFIRIERSNFSTV